MAKKSKAKSTTPKRIHFAPQKPTGPAMPNRVMDTMKIFENTEKAMKTVDGYDNFISKVGLNNENPLSAGVYIFNLITRNRLLLEAAYRGSWIVGNVVDVVAVDMTKSGITVTTNEGKENLKELKNATSRLQIAQSLCSLVKWGRLYGGAIAVPQIEGQKLDTPINLDTIAKDQFKGLVVYDRWQVNPILTELIDSGPDMGLPKFYQIVSDPRMATAEFKTPYNSLKVHHSRVIRNIGIELPYFQAITEQLWGESRLERLWDRLISFDNATMSSAQLIDRANLRTVKVDSLREIIAAGGEAQQGLLAQFEMMRFMQTNEGLTLLDKNDEFATTSYSFAGLSDMLLQHGQQLSGAAGIPLVKLFGQSPAGLSATGEADIRMYYDEINAQQESSLRAGWEMIIKLLWRSTFGKPAPKDLEFTFTPLWQMSALDKATIAKTNAESIIGANEAGLLKNSTAMQELRQNSGESGVFSNITDEDISEAEKSDDDPPLPGEGGAPGEAGPDGEKKIKTPVPSLDAKTSTIKKVKNWVLGR